MPSADWRDALYRQTYDDILANLRKRREIDASFSLEEARGILRHLYILDGHGWGGRGESQEAALSAQIAAHEAFIAAWESEGGA